MVIIKQSFMNKTNNLIIGTFMALFFMASCVPVKQFTDLKSKADTYQNDNNQLKEENQKLTV